MQQIKSIQINIILIIANNHLYGYNVNKLLRRLKKLFKGMRHIMAYFHDKYVRIHDEHDLGTSSWATYRGFLLSYNLFRNFCQSYFKLFFNKKKTIGVNTLENEMFEVGIYFSKNLNHFNISNIQTSNFVQLYLKQFKLSYLTNSKF